MRQIYENFVGLVNTAIRLGGKRVLEVGLGTPAESVRLAAECLELVGIDPDSAAVAAAKEMGIPRAVFLVGRPEKLEFFDDTFDVVIFNQSLHRVPTAQIKTAISEALRVLKYCGFIVFREPGTEGSLFDAEVMFLAGEIDEHVAKANASEFIRACADLDLYETCSDEDVFIFASLQDFLETMKPKKDVSAVEPFLLAQQYCLTAKRKISIFRPKRR